MAGKAALLSSPGVVRHGPLRIWAERGLIHIEDSRDGSYDSVTVRQALRRMQAVNDMIPSMLPEHREHNVSMVEGMLTLTERAKVQGMPDDPSARRDRARRQPRSFVVPDTAVAMP